jgi:unsaturated rhamnogalacturonyl hydrolase
MNKLKSVLFFLVIGFSLQVSAQDFNLKKFPKEKSPEKIGKQLAEKYLNTPHSRFGNTRQEQPPTLITYPDVCTWLGGLWFAKETKDTELFNKLEKRFEPLFNEEKHLQPKPNHVDNNVFGALPFEFYLQTKEKKYFELGLYYADTQW